MYIREGRRYWTVNYPKFFSFAVSKRGSLVYHHWECIYSPLSYPLRSLMFIDYQSKLKEVRVYGRKLMFHEFKSTLLLLKDIQLRYRTIKPFQYGFHTDWYPLDHNLFLAILKKHVLYRFKDNFLRLVITVLSALPFGHSALKFCMSSPW